MATVSEHGSPGLRLRFGVTGFHILAVMLVLGLAGCSGGSDANDAGGTVPPPNPPPSSPPPSPTPDTTAPSVSIGNPGGATTVTASPITVSGSATDDIGVTQVSWSTSTGGSGNASRSGSGTGITWSASVPLQSGANTITVTARDAAGNASAARSVTVTYNPPAPPPPGGQGAISGQVDSSRVDRFGGNAVYVYAGTAVPDDRGGSGANPVATAAVSQDPGACTFRYQLNGLASGTYTLAFTRQAGADNPAADDSIGFVGTAQVSVTSGATTTHNVGAARVLRVGPGRSYATPKAAAGAAQAGDVVEIDAGVYDDDIAIWRQNDLTLRGVGGRAHLRATRQIAYSSGDDQANGMGIWVTRGRNMRVENIEFSGASVADQNGAGIRVQSLDLTVCNGYFHDNENGILGGGGHLLIEYSEFAGNGRGDGYTHNMYIDDGDKLTLRHSYSHHAKIGHNVKTRARENYILYNRIMDEVSGSASYQIDVPDGGLTYVIGNLVQQGPMGDNSIIIAYGAESNLNGRAELYVINNTIVNDRGSGTALSIRGGTTAKIVNNIFSGNGMVGGTGTMLNNLQDNSPGLVNIGGYDYRLTAGSLARDAGTDPGGANGYDLRPAYQYLHKANREARPSAGTMDIGAYEYAP
ncbi:MAG TPA: Ig-like domain-containing protein [Acidiferrobacterales bacterium]